MVFIDLSTGALEVFVQRRGRDAAYPARFAQSDAPWSFLALDRMLADTVADIEANAHDLD